MEEHSTNYATSDLDSGFDTGLNTDRSNSTHFETSTIRDSAETDDGEWHNDVSEMNNNQVPKVVINDEPHTPEQLWHIDNGNEHSQQQSIVDDEDDSNLNRDGHRIDGDGNHISDVESQQGTDDSHLATDGSFAEETSDVSFSVRIEDIMSKVDASKLDENNWMAVLKAMDIHYKTRLSLQTETHLHKMHDLKLQLEDQLTLRQCEIQERLASHHNLLTADEQISESATSPDTDYYSPDANVQQTLPSSDPYQTYNGMTGSTGSYTDHGERYKESYRGDVVYKGSEMYSKDFSRGDVVHMPEIGVYHVQQPNPYVGERYQLDTPVMKAMNLKKKISRRTQDSGFTDGGTSTGMKGKSRSVFSGDKPTYSYDAISPSRLFPSPDLERSSPNGRQGDSSSDFLDLPVLRVSSVAGANMATDQNESNNDVADYSESERTQTPGGDEDEGRQTDDDVTLADDVSGNKENIMGGRGSMVSDGVVATNGSLLHGNGKMESPADGEAVNYRIRLNEKYSRHLAEMKAYYESEIRSLREELIQSRDQHLTSLRATRDYDIGARDVDHAALRSRCDLLEGQNKSLAVRIDQLENALSESQRECNKRQRQISRLDCEMDNAERRVTMYMEDAQKLMEEHEKLRKEHRSVQSSLSSTENQLYDCRNELTDYKGRISRLELERLRLERENEQMREKLHQQIDWIPEGRPHHRRNQSDAVARSLNQSEPLTRSASQSETRSVCVSENRSAKMSRSFTCQPMSLQNDVTSSREPIRSHVTSRRQSMPARTNPIADFSSANRLTVPQVNHSKVTPTNIAPPTDEAVANAPVARQRRARQAFGKSPRKSLCEEFRQSMSVEKDEDEAIDGLRRPRPKLQKAQQYDETDLDDSPRVGAGDALSTNQRIPARVDLAELERQLDSLSMDKRTVETALSHIPIRGTRQDRMDKEHLDQRLDDIHASLGAVRMQLKKYHVLKTSR